MPLAVLGPETQLCDTAVTPNPSVDYPDSYYAATANPHPRYPQLKGELAADVCVVGGGFTGLSAALHLAERGYAVALLEGARVGWGASGRNGGQVGSGLRCDVTELEPALGRATTRELWKLAEEAKAILRHRIDRHAIDCDFKDGNLLAVTKRRYLRDLAHEAEHLARHYDYDGYRMVAHSEMRELVASRRYCGGRFDRGGGHLHPLNLALGMAGAAAAAGTRIFELSRVARIEWTASPLVKTAHGVVRARYVVLCANAYLGRLEPRIASTLMPISNHVLATAPLGAERARALIRNDCCVHASKFVVDYYRLTSDHRLLFGGGETYGWRPPPDAKRFVRRYMLEVFPQLADVGIDYGWDGEVGITRSRLPHFGRLPGGGFFAQGFSGHGVVLTQIAGRLLAEAVAGTAERFDVFASLRARPFPGGPWMRKPLLVAGMLYYALRDRL